MESAAIRRVFSQIDRAARAADLNGDGDGDGDSDDTWAPRLATLDDRLRAVHLFLDAKLGPLPDWLRDAAVERCERIVAMSTPPQADANRTEGGAVVPRRERQARGLRREPTALASPFAAAELAGLTEAVRGGAVR